MCIYILYIYIYIYILYIFYIYIGVRAKGGPPPAERSRLAASIQSNSPTDALLASWTKIKHM